MIFEVGKILGMSHLPKWLHQEIKMRYLTRQKCKFKLKYLIIVDPNNGSSVQLVFLQKPVQQWCTNMTSFYMQFEKGGCGLLWEANRREGESVVGWKFYYWKFNMGNRRIWWYTRSIIVTCCNKQYGSDLVRHSQKSTCLHWYLNPGPQPRSKTYIRSRPLGYGPLLGTYLSASTCIWNTAN